MTEGRDGEKTRKRQSRDGEMTNTIWLAGGEMHERRGPLDYNATLKLPAGRNLPILVYGDAAPSHHETERGSLNDYGCVVHVDCSVKRVRRLSLEVRPNRGRFR